METGEGQKARVVAELKALLEAGSLAGADGRLPPLRDLAERLSTGRNTMEDALEELKRQGLVFSRPRVGYFLRQRVQNARKSISEDDCCSKVRYWPGVGILAEKAALTGEWRGFLESSLRESEGELLVRCAPCDGDPNLREAIAESLPPSGCENPEPSHVVATQGATGALSLGLTFALNRGKSRRVAFEVPAFLPLDASEPVLREVEWVPVERMAGQLDMDALASEGAKGLAAFVVTPTLHNPTGGTLPLQSRFGIAALAQKHDFTIVELSPQDALSPVEPPPAIASFCPERTLYVSSASKVLGSGLRVGWLWACAEFLAWHKGRCTRPVCTHASAFAQDVVARFLRSPHFDKHIEELKALLSRNSRMHFSVAEESGVGRFEPWQGGLFQRLVVPGLTDPERFCREMRDVGVFLRSDIPFFWNGPSRSPHWLRFNLSQCSDGDVREVFQAMSAVLSRGRPFS